MTPDPLFLAGREAEFGLALTPFGVRWAWLVVEEKNSARWSLALREGRRERERAALPMTFVEAHRAVHDRRTLFAACQLEPCVGNQAELAALGIRT